MLRVASRSDRGAGSEMGVLHSPINHRAVLGDLAGQLLRWSRCGGGSHDGRRGVPAAPSRHYFFRYIFASLVWIPDSDRFFLSFSRWRLLLLCRHYDGC